MKQPFMCSGATGRDQSKHRLLTQTTRNTGAKRRIKTTVKKRIRERGKGKGRGKKHAAGRMSFWPAPESSICLTEREGAGDRSALHVSLSSAHLHTLSLPHSSCASTGPVHHNCLAPGRKASVFPPEIQTRNHNPPTPPRESRARSHVLKDRVSLLS